MGLFSLEHGPLAYRADIGFYTASVGGLAAWLWRDAPRHLAPSLAALVLAGLAGWSLLEYLLHRFVLHGLPPFKRWHGLHHQRPAALMGAPTTLSATLFATLVAAPAWALLGRWPALALSLGVLTGYLGYTLTHHAIHHWPLRSRWLDRRRHWHALHHHARGAPGCFGVTSGLWDQVFGTRRLPVTTARGFSH